MKTPSHSLLMFIVAVVLSSPDAVAQVNWAKYPGNPVLTGGALGSWFRQVLMPCVLHNADSSRFEMWFAASAYPYSEFWCNGLGFAVSPDGISWTMHPTPVLTASATDWEEGNVDIPWVIRESGQYKMWYSGGRTYRKTGYATSADGITWTKHAGNPVFEPKPNSWDAGLVHCGTVVPAPGDTGGYRMYYSGGFPYIYTKEEIGVAYSKDGIVWERDTVRNPILSAGPEGAWDDTWIFAPRILFRDGLYNMWYGGTGEYWGVYWLGLATSPDGIAWQRYAGNPVLMPSPGTWDAYKILSGCVLLVGDTLVMMWYDAVGAAGTAQLWSVGLATVITYVEPTPAQPEAFSLSQNFPNPFNPSTTIIFSLPRSVEARLSVFDMFGREVSVLVNERRDAGLHRVTFDAQSLSSGVYFYRLRAGDFAQTNRLLLLR